MSVGCNFFQTAYLCIRIHHDRKQSNHLDAAKVDSELLHYIHNTYKLSFLEPTLKTFGRKTGWAKRFVVVCCMGQVNLETAACDGTMEDVD